MAQRPDDFDDREDDGGDDDLFGRRTGDRDRPRRRPALTDFVRRTIENTVGSVPSAGSASREALDYLLKQGDRQRREIFRVVANEVGDFLRHVDLAGEVVKVLTSVQLEVNASVRFRPTGHGRVEVDPTSELSVDLAGDKPAAERAADKAPADAAHATPSTAPPRRDDAAARRNDVPPREGDPA
jgi:hypothetical protein